MPSLLEAQVLSPAQGSRREQSSRFSGNRGSTSLSHTGEEDGTKQNINKQADRSEVRKRSLVVPNTDGGQRLGPSSSFMGVLL